MRKLIKNITDRYKHAKMKNQLIIMYFSAVFVPILLVGIILVAGNARRLVTYHSDLLKANNNRIRSVLYEITSQIYSISGEIAFNNDLVEVLSMEYPDERAFKSEVDKLGSLEYYQNNYSGISGVEIYTSQRGVQNYRNFRPITDDVVMSDWYKTASGQYSVFWDSVERENTGGNKYRGLALVRKITLYDSDTEAILLIHVSDNYLKSRVEDNEEDVLLALENKNVFYSNERDNEGRSDLLNVIEGGDEYFSYEGDMEYRGAMNMTYISTLSMKQSDSLMYIVTISNSAYNSVQQIVMITVLIIALAVILPAVLMRFFIMGFSSQVGRMRDEMYSASQGDYDSMEDFDGCYELTAAYKDLWIMLDKIKEKDAAMYAKEINEQKLLNAQQKMEFQMLASQINPHFLYNTLEMIRMKAITVGDTETATAIKLLGKSMRYVLDNTGIEYTTVAKELSHIETYLQIQKLRFGERVNYEIRSEEDINLNKIRILPLLLQPIVENAILHGLEEVESGGQITVNIHRDINNPDTLIISIRDNGCGMDADTLNNMRINLEKGNISKRYGIGLYNINQRIRLCYGMGYGLSIDSEEGNGTTVTARIKIM